MNEQRRPKILVVEDERDLLTGLEDNLKVDGYRVITALNGEEGLKLAKEAHPNLLILDLMLPGIDGYEVLRALRKNSKYIPVIILTAKGEIPDKLKGFKLGVDDYITKPFGLEELLARIKAVLRRTYYLKNLNIKHYEFNNIKIDFCKYEVKKRQEKVELTAREFEVLKILIIHKGEVISRAQLLDEVWGYNIYPSTRTIDNHILSLRKKLEKFPDKPEHIITVRRGGYKFVD